MKIVHVSLVGYPYISGWGYQENHMIDVHRMMGHDVVEISLRDINNMYMEHVNRDCTFDSFEYIDEYGIKIYRLSNKLSLPYSINGRIRYFNGIYRILQKEKPDVIFVHDIQFVSVFDIIKYAKQHPECVLKADMHATYENSAKNFFAKYILHGIFYKRIVRRAYRSFQKIYYITYGAKDFFEEIYSVNTNTNRFEFMPLGGMVMDESEYMQRRKKIRDNYFVRDSDFLIVHSGKLEKAKRTHELIQAFSKIGDKRIKLFIIGSIPKSQEEILNNDFASDDRISFLGWKKADELKSFLCAADAYCQPGTESSTLQTAMCCGCPCILNMCEDIIGGGYKRYIPEECVVKAKSIDEIYDAIVSLMFDINRRQILREAALTFSREHFDYFKQVERLIKDERENN